jgi:hypothetical protein
MDYLIQLRKLSAVACILILLLGFSVTLYLPVMAATSETTQTPAKMDAQRLNGRWQRPDGGYVLELKELKKDGNLKAAYFNPQPIKVFKAKWERKQNIVSVYIELRDINYPGSKYNLRYDPKTDRLRGTYFQAVYGETYDVEFVRVK